MPLKAQGAVNLGGGWGGGRLGSRFPHRESELNEMNTGDPVSSAFTTWQGAGKQHEA